MSTRSMDAYQNILRTLNQKETLIFNCLGTGDYTAEVIARYTSMNIITARARLSEMFDKGIIAQKENGQYYTTHNDNMEEVQKQRLEAKFNKWVKLGLKHDWHFRYETFIKHGGAPEPHHYE